MKDIPLRASLNIDSSEEVCSLGNTDGDWKLNPSSVILIWVDMDMGQLPKLLFMSPMSGQLRMEEDNESAPTSSILTLPSHTFKFPSAHCATNMTEKPLPNFDWELFLTIPLL